MRPFLIFIAIFTPTFGVAKNLNLYDVALHITNDCQLSIVYPDETRKKIPLNIQKDQNSPCFFIKISNSNIIRIYERTSTNYMVLIGSKRITSKQKCISVYRAVLVDKNSHLLLSKYKRTIPNCLEPTNDLYYYFFKMLEQQNNK